MKDHLATPIFIFSELRKRQAPTPSGFDGDHEVGLSDCKTRPPAFLPAGMLSHLPVFRAASRRGEVQPTSDLPPSALLIFKSPIHSRLPQIANR